jgi:hypothetical protein
MSENDKPGDETQPVRRQGEPEPAPASQPAPEPAPAPTGSASASGPAPGPGPATSDPAAGSRFRRWRNQQRGDRTFGLAALVASALAGVIVGGLGTAVVDAVTDDHDRGGWVERHGQMGRDGDDFGGRGPMHGGPPGVPGQVQPTTPPEDEGSTS